MSIDPKQLDATMQKRLLSHVHNKSPYEWWQKAMLSVADFGLGVADKKLTPAENADYINRVERFPRSIPSRLATWFEQRDRAWHDEVIKRPFGVWPHNRKPTEPRNTHQGD